MSIRQRVYGTFGIWLVGSFGLGLAAAYVSEVFLVPVLILLAVAGFVTMRTRCPVCGHPVLKREAGTAIGHLKVWVPFVPNRCTHCGAPLASPRVPPVSAVGPSPQKADIARLSAELEEKFGDLRIPRPEEVVLGGCDEPECSKLRNMLGGRHWRDLTSAELLAEPQALALLTPVAFRFYLPAFIRASLDGLDRGGELADSILSCLAEPDSRHLEREQRAFFTDRTEASHFSGTPVSARAPDPELSGGELNQQRLERLDSLSAGQRGALVHFLRILRRYQREDFSPGELEHLARTLTR